MANEEHVRLISQPGGDWNKWRADHPDTRPDLRGADLAGQWLLELNLEGADMRGARLGASSLTTSVLRGADLTQADASGVRFNECDLRDVRARGVRAIGSSFFKCQVDRADFRLDGTDVPEGQETVIVLTAYGAVTRPNGVSSDFTGAEFFECSMTESNFDLARFQEIRAIKTTFERSSFRGADFAPRQAAEVSLRNAVLENANLCGANLGGVDLSGANLQGAALIDARLGPGRMVQTKNLSMGPDGTKWTDMTFFGFETALRAVDMRAPTSLARASYRPT